MVLVKFLASKIQVGPTTKYLLGFNQVRNYDGSWTEWGNLIGAPIVNETRENIRTQLHDVRERVLDTVDEARETVMRPVRHYSAIALAFAEGVRTFFFGGKREQAKTPGERPAA